MPILGKIILLTAYIRTLRGGSQPILAQASDGLLYVVKFTNNLQGANLLFNESIGTELYHACGLAVPLWKPLLITDDFIDHNPDCWMHTQKGRLRPAVGLCFGSRFLGRDVARLLEILPGTSFNRVRNHMSFWLAWLIDICALHADNRQAIFLEDGLGWLDAFFVDQGHFFGGPKEEQQPHFLASRYLDPRVYQNVSSQQRLRLIGLAGAVDVDKLWKRVQELPDDWKTTSALKVFSECLCRLSNAVLLRNIFDTMMNAQQRTRIVERKEQQNGQQLPKAVLCSGVQAAGV